eukprot:14007748-Alexandrium_andersonii.AAC.1
MLINVLMRSFAVMRTPMVAPMCCAYAYALHAMRGGCSTKYQALSKYRQMQMHVSRECPEDKCA